MTGIYIIAVLLIGQISAEVVELSCADNATCINNLGRQLYTSIKQRKTVRLFDLITIEPLRTRESRSYKGPLTRLLTSHAISFDWNDFTFRLSNPDDKDDSMDLEVFENRSNKGECTLDSKLLLSLYLENKLITTQNMNLRQSEPIILISNVTSFTQN